MLRLDLPAVLPLLPRLLRALFALAGFGLVMWWIVRLTAPGPVAALPSVGSAPLPMPAEQALLRLFGGDSSGMRRDDPVLTGIFAQRGGRSFITFRDGAESRFVFVGDEIRPGVWVVAIHPDHVLLSERGVERRLTTPAQPASLPSAFSAETEEVNVR